MENCKIFILGSCVSRDIFSTMDKDEYIGGYRARTSIHTVFKNPIPLGMLPDLSVIESNWQRRMVEFDFTKKPLEIEDSEYIIVDFIDERFQKGFLLGSMITLSDQVTRKIISKDKLVPAFKQGTSKDYNHWRGSCEVFANWVLNTGKKVILHRSRFSEVHTRDGKLEQNPKQAFIEKMNKIITKYEKIFINKVPVVGFINVKNDLLVSDPEHIWGLAPFHYIPEYYENAWSQIYSIISEGIVT